jgi:membrane associated rhomboid family serine protease
VSTPVSNIPFEPSDSDPTHGKPSRYKTSVGGRIAQPGIVGVGVLLTAQWVSEIVDFFMKHRLDRYGVRPHQLLGLRGIAFAPFLHSGFRHLIGNTVPFAVLGVLIALGGLRQFLSVTVITAFISGLGMWLFGSSNEVHIGASGVVFGYLAYLLVRGLFARNLRQIGLGVVVAMIYGGLLWGVLPTNSGVSWQGHLFGAIGGVIAAKLLAPPAAKPTS